MNHRKIHRCTGMFAAAVILMAIMTDSPPSAGASDASQSSPMTSAEQKVVHGAQQSLARKDHAQAERLLRAFLDAHAGQPHHQVIFTLANTLALGGHHRAALDQYLRITDRLPEEPALWQNMGRVHYELKQYDQAGECLAKAHRLSSPPSTSLAYQAGVAYILGGRPAAARPLLEALVVDGVESAEPEWIEALLKVYIDLGQSGKGLALARDLLRRQGDRPHLWQLLARLHIDRGEYREAAAALEIRMALKHPEPEEIKQLGDLYLMAHIPRMAAVKYEALLDEQAQAADYERTASAFIAARCQDKAKAVLRRGLGHRHSTRLLWLLAGIHYESGAFDDAYHTFGDIVQAHPDNARAHLMMGYCALQVGRLQDARTAFAQAVHCPKQGAEAEKRLKEIDAQLRASSKEVVENAQYQ